MPTDLPADIGRRFVTIEEAARQLNLSPKHLRRDIKANKLRVHRFGRAQRISAEDLEDYVRRHRQ